MTHELTSFICLLFSEIKWLLVGNVCMVQSNQKLGFPNIYSQKVFLQLSEDVAHTHIAHATVDLSYDN